MFAIGDKVQVGLRVGKMASGKVVDVIPADNTNDGMYCVVFDQNHDGKYGGWFNSDVVFELNSRPKVDLMDYVREQVRILHNKGVPVVIPGCPLPKKDW